MRFIAISLVLVTFSVYVSPNVPVLGQENKEITQGEISNKTSAAIKDIVNDPKLKEKWVDKLDREINKLEEEIASLKALSPTDRWWSTMLGALGGAAGGVFALGIALVGWKMKKSFTDIQEAKMRQDKEMTREKHLLNLFQSLGNESPRIQISAAAVLIQKLKTLWFKAENKLSSEEYEERKTITQVLLSVTKERQSEKYENRALLKYIADNLVAAMGVIHEKEEDLLKQGSRLAAYDFQEAILVNVFWKGVDARGVDFFRADLSEASLRESWLSQAIFYEANLKKAVLKGAVLKDANLTRAKLQGANLTQAILLDINLQDAEFDLETKWPDGFDPLNKGAIFVEN